MANAMYRRGFWCFMLSFRIGRAHVLLCTSSQNRRREELYRFSRKMCRISQRFVLNPGSDIPTSLSSTTADQASCLCLNLSGTRLTKENASTRRKFATRHNINRAGRKISTHASRAVRATYTPTPPTLRNIPDATNNIVSHTSDTSNPSSGCRPMTALALRHRNCMSIPTVSMREKTGRRGGPPRSAYIPCITQAEGGKVFPRNGNIHREASKAVRGRQKPGDQSQRQSFMSRKTVLRCRCGRVLLHKYC